MTIQEALAETTTDTIATMHGGDFILTAAVVEPGVTLLTQYGWEDGLPVWSQPFTTEYNLWQYLNDQNCLDGWTLKRA